VRVIRVVIPALVVCVFALAGAGCGQIDRVVEVEVMRNEAGMIRNGPFGPSAMRIHPLTHAEVVDGESRIVVHMELTDAWGDTVKGLGGATVELSRVGSVRGEGVTRWDIALGEVRPNLSYFDAVTRTYRFVLTEVPAWFERDRRGRLAMTYKWATAGGDVVSRQDSFEIEASATGEPGTGG